LPVPRPARPAFPVGFRQCGFFAVRFPVPAVVFMPPIYPFSHPSLRPFAPSTLVKDFTFISVSAKTRLTSISPPQKPIKNSQKVIKNDQKQQKTAKNDTISPCPS
jgi:hypothetical protein